MIYDFFLFQVFHRHEMDTNDSLETERIHAHYCKGTAWWTRLPPTGRGRSFEAQIYPNSSDRAPNEFSVQIAEIHAILEINVFMSAAAR